MALTYNQETLYYVECDGCRCRAPFGFRRHVAVLKARHAGFHLHKIAGAKDSEVWFCGTCHQEHGEVTSVSSPKTEKPSLPAVSARN